LAADIAADPAGDEPARSATPPQTRRSILRVSAAGLGAIGLAGCGGAVHRRAHRRRLTPAAAEDVKLLNAALAVEQRSIAAYTAITPLLSGRAHDAASVFLGNDLEHAGELRKLITHLRGQAHDPLPRYDFGRPRGARELLGVLHGLETQQLGAYLRALPLLSTGELRQSVGAILANDAQHIAILRGELNQPALDSALLTAAG
jgi:hypothetical protein